ncbi:MAG: hypothetical protein R3F39_09135 [Myxococcota bacterium]
MKSARSLWGLVCVVLAGTAGGACGGDGDDPADTTLGIAAGALTEACAEPLCFDGPDMDVNTSAALGRERPAVAEGADGAALVVFVGETLGNPAAPGDGPVRGRFYGADGVAVGADFAISTATNRSQADADVAAGAGGGYLVVWSERTRANANTQAASVRARRVAADGAPVGGDFAVAVTSALAEHRPVVGALPDGGYVVVWRDRVAAGASGRRILAQRLDSGGAAVGGVIAVSTPAPEDPRHPAVAVAADGRWLAVWVAKGGGGYSVQSRLFSVDGAPLRWVEYLDAGAKLHQHPTVAAGGDGGFLAAWEEASENSGESWNVWTRGVWASGAPAGFLEIVSSAVGGRQRQPAAGFEISGGRYVVAWADDRPWTPGDKGWTIHGRTLGADWGFAGEDTRINTTDKATPSWPAVAARANRKLWVAWSDVERAKPNKGAKLVRARMATLAVCGNGTVEVTEECDDGNVAGATGTGGVWSRSGAWGRAAADGGLRRWGRVHVVNTCVPAVGCVYEVVSCDDGLACTADSCDAQTGCQHAAVDCDDGDACTADGCDALVGARMRRLAATTATRARPMGDALTGCVHEAVSCDDASACTTDSCNRPGCERAGVVRRRKRLHYRRLRRTRAARIRRHRDDGTGAPPIPATHKPVASTPRWAATTGRLHHRRLRRAGGLHSRGCELRRQDACTADGCDTQSGCTHEAISCDDASACTTGQLQPGVGVRERAGVVRRRKRLHYRRLRTRQHGLHASGGVVRRRHRGVQRHRFLQRTNRLPARRAGLRRRGSLVHHRRLRRAAGCTHAGVSCDDGDARHGRWLRMFQSGWHARGDLLR